jgi:hypothetical protein
MHLGVIGWLGILAISLVHAQDAPTPLKNDATATIKLADQLRQEFTQIGINSVTIIETPHLVIASTLEAGPLRTLSTRCEKVIEIVQKTLKLNDGQPPLDGKLLVCYLPERRSFRTYVLEILKEQPERAQYVMRVDQRQLVTTGRAPGIVTEADRNQLVTAQVAIMLLRSKYPQPQYFQWMITGLGQACALRSEGLQSPRYRAYRKQAQALARNPAISPQSLWRNREVSEQMELLATSFMEFLAFGPFADSLDQFLSTPDKLINRLELENLGLSEAILEQGWRSWTLGVSPSKPLPNKK